LLMWLKNNPTYSRKAAESGLSLVSVTFTGWLKVLQVCQSLQPFCLKMYLRYANSTWRLSWSHGALAQWTTMQNMACLNGDEN
jgi:hypothetical protein